MQMFNPNPDPADVQKAKEALKVCFTCYWGSTRNRRQAWLCNDAYTANIGLLLAPCSSMILI